MKRKAPEITNPIHAKLVQEAKINFFIYCALTIVVVLLFIFRPLVMQHPISLVADFVFLTGIVVFGYRSGKHHLLWYRRKQLFSGINEIINNPADHS